MSTLTTSAETAITTVSTEISRTDSKAGLLLTLDGLLVAALGLLGTDVRGWALGLAIVAAAALTVSVGLAVRVIRPQLAPRGPRDASFVTWAVATEDEIRQSLDTGCQVIRIQVLSRIAVRKMRRLRLAGDTSLVAVVATAAALLVR